MNDGEQVMNKGLDLLYAEADQTRRDLIDSEYSTEQVEAIRALEAALKGLETANLCITSNRDLTLSDLRSCERYLDGDSCTWEGRPISHSAVLNMDPW